VSDVDAKNVLELATTDDQAPVEVLAAGLPIQRSMC
jgi:hypothetical protein